MHVEKKVSNARSTEHRGAGGVHRVGELWFYEVKEKKEPNQKWPAPQKRKRTKKCSQRENSDMSLLQANSATSAHGLLRPTHDQSEYKMTGRSMENYGRASSRKKLGGEARIKRGVESAATN